jgi:hypothetical protein
MRAWHSCLDMPTYEPGNNRGSQTTTESLSDASASSAELADDLERWGDRTSSLVTAYSGFSDFTCGNLSGRIRYAQVKGGLWQPEAWAGATEPIAPIPDRVLYLEEFFSQARSRGFEAFFMPVSEELSQAASAMSHRTCVGAEPIFILDERRFNEGLASCLKKFPNARALLNKGYRIESRAAGQIDLEIKKEIARLEREWKKSLRAAPMGFLNQVNPDVFADTRYKIFFLLFAPSSNRLVACLSALEIPAREGWYFTEVFRALDAPHGATPLLMFGAMLELRKKGAKEVRLGMAPLAFEVVAPRWTKELGQNGVGKFLLRLSKKDSPLYGFRSAFIFKKRLQPSRWDPLFLISADRPSWKLLAQVVCAHFPNQNLWEIAQAAVIKSFEARVFPWLNERALSALSAFPRTVPWLTGVLGFFLLALHLLPEFSSNLKLIYDSSTYMPAAVSWNGWLLGPLFHNHLYHLLGDWVSFLFFGGLLEALLGTRMLLGVMALGFWLTNPLADVLVRVLHHWVDLAVISDSAFQAFLNEQDRGSSNAVYAYVGALSVLLTPRFSRVLLVPFIANGIYLCWVRDSWLSLHHLIGVALGAGVVRLWLMRHESKQG